MIFVLSNVQSWDCVRRCCFCYYIFCTILCSHFVSPLFFCLSGKKNTQQNYIQFLSMCRARTLHRRHRFRQQRKKMLGVSFFLANNRIRFVAPFNLLLCFFFHFYFSLRPEYASLSFSAWSMTFFVISVHAFVASQNKIFKYLSLMLLLFRKFRSCESKHRFTHSTMEMNQRKKQKK